jgi:hypothetical protein
MLLTHKIIYPPMSPRAYSHIGGGDFQKAWTPLGGVLIRGYGDPDFPVRLTGIEPNGAQSQVHFMIPMRAEVLEEMGKALLDLAAIARECAARTEAIRRATRIE